MINSVKGFIVNCSMLQSSFSHDKIEAGCDEVGRGCLAGPVVAAAVILPKNFQHGLLNDSKKLTASVRQQLDAIIKHDKCSWILVTSAQFREILLGQTGDLFINIDLIHSFD